MAGRFVLQKLASSGMSRSASRLVGAQASALSRATAPVITRAPEDGIRNLSKFFHAAAAAVRPAGSVVVPSISNHGGIRGYGAARYLNTLPNGPAKIRRFKARRMPPSINNNNHNKSSALVDSVGEVKPTCSPDASNKLKLVEEPWHSRFVDWASKKYKGLHQIDICLIKLFVWANCMTAALAYTWPEEDVSTSSMIPSQSLHCSGCNCRNRLHCSGCNCRNPSSK